MMGRWGRQSPPPTPTDLSSHELASSPTQRDPFRFNEIGRQSSFKRIGYMFDKARNGAKKYGKVN
jgi:hypothetical protein